ncbi:MAG: FtsX-like permease family protein [Phycisphaerae bacterium]|jgi:lipoprotein-releasing system permease protein
MYKLFLCLRYLRSRVIAYFAVLGVALCVAMMLIVVSVMDGFLNKVEKAAKGLFGDIVMEGPKTGMGLYDEFIADAKRQVPEVEAASPFILNYCFLKVPWSEWNEIVQAAGIRLPERAKVTDFAKGLFVQKDAAAPTFDPPVAMIDRRLKEENQAIEAIADRYKAKGEDESTLKLLSDLGKGQDALLASRLKLVKAQGAQARLAELEAQIAAAKAAANGEDTEASDKLEKELDELCQATGYWPPSRHIILGLGVRGLSFRTPEGQTIRRLAPGENITASVLPLGQLSAASLTSLSWNTRLFTIVDDCKTDVSSIDNNIVYIPFETIQRMSGMEAKVDANNRIVSPARCSQIHFKVRGGDEDERYLGAVRARIEGVWSNFRLAHPELAGTEAVVETWRQRQANLIGPIEKQRTLTVIMFGIISLVSVVLIFVIFYMIVFQKTKDIGVLKAIGASSGGVAGIFLAYGAAVGLVGSIIGTIGGYYFVLYINNIQDFIDKYFGFRVWDREIFMFEKIPNEVELVPALLIVAGAIVAGLVGALIPAWRAARMQPVEALRYE